MAVIYTVLAVVLILVALYALGGAFYMAADAVGGSILKIWRKICNKNS